MMCAFSLFFFLISISFCPSFIPGEFRTNSRVIFWVQQHRKIAGSANGKPFCSGTSHQPMTSRHDVTFYPPLGGNMLPAWTLSPRWRQRSHPKQGFLGRKKKNFVVSMLFWSHYPAEIVAYFRSEAIAQVQWSRYRSDREKHAANWPLRRGWS